MLAHIQKGLQELYRVDSDLQVEDFLIDEEMRDQVAPDRTPGEQLFLHQGEDDLAVGLYLDDNALQNLKTHDPRQHLGEHNLKSFLWAVEGVSHFVYLTFRAAHEKQVSALELELQAEVDKFLSCVLLEVPHASRSQTYRTRLFENFSWEENLSDVEKERYQVANDNAHEYAKTLESRYLAKGRVCEMLTELRHFYRMSLTRKMDFIAQTSNRR